MCVAYTLHHIKAKIRVKLKELMEIVSHCLYVSDVCCRKTYLNKVSRKIRRKRHAIEFFSREVIRSKPEIELIY